jgi:hypothetical protein
MSSSERQTTSENDSRRTTVIVVAVVAAVVIGGFFYFLLRATGGGSTPPATLEGAIRAGTPEFAEYHSKIFLEKPEADEARRPLGDIVMTVRSTVRNFTNRTLNGLEVKASVVDYEGKPIKERSVIVIPTRQSELAPNKTMPVAVMLEGFSESDARANIKMEITAFRFK